MDILDSNLKIQRNFFIEASAGTGKTFAIENIVVRLVEEGIPIEKILVVTFTRAATFELKMRILRNLEKKKMKTALPTLDTAKIFTIHGFCFHSLKESALETGFSLNPLEQMASLKTLKQIFKDFLRGSIAEDDIHPKQIERVLHLHQNDLTKVLKSLTASSTSTARSFSEIYQDIRSEIENLHFTADSIFEHLLKEASKFHKMCDRKKQLKEEIHLELFRFSRCFNGEIDGLFDLSILKMTPDNLLKNQTYPEVLERLNYKLIPLLQELNQPNSILGFLKSKFEQFLSIVREKEDLIFYDDLLKKMHSCVQNNNVFVKKLRSSFQAVLIDEFQDTDRMQWEIFSSLFLGYVPLYLVGDPKQSIYRFRGADVYTYIEAKNAMGEEAHTTLTRNFRSDSSLVSALNTLFCKSSNLLTLPKTGQALAIPRIEPALDSLKGKIIFFQAEDESALFNFIVEEVQRLHEKENIAYKECAVLVKDQYQSKRFSKACPLPFVQKKSESLHDSETLSICEDLLIAAYNPRDRNAVAKAIGGPIFQMPLMSLRKNLEEGVILFHYYHQLLRKEGILSFFKAVANRGSFPTTKLYLELLQIVELIAQKSSQFEEILPTLQKLKQEDPESETLKAWSKSGYDAIQVMTTHVSKGLEFKVVFPMTLICPFESDEEEEIAEKMRQLYVAITRAKTWLYLPVIEKENTPIHYLLKGMLQGETLHSFVQQNEHFSLIHCVNKKFTAPEKVSRRSLHVLPGQISFPSVHIHSFTTLAKHKDYWHFEEKSKMHATLPPGPETGVILHRIFELLDFRQTLDQIRSFIASQIKHTLLGNCLEAIVDIVHNVLHFPFSTTGGPFFLEQVDPRHMRKEMVFLYQATGNLVGYIKGFIDLFFEHAGQYYLIDWKSNCLDDYSPQKLEEAMIFYDYITQAELYKTAALKFLKMFHADGQFGGIFYVFLRGLDSQKQMGVYKL